MGPACVCCALFSRFDPSGAHPDGVSGSSPPTERFHFPPPAGRPGAWALSSETDNRCPEREEEAPTGQAGAGGWPGRKPSGRRHTPVSGNTFPHHVTPGLRCPECPTKEPTGASTAVGGRMGAFRPLLSQVTPRLSSPLPRCPAPDPDPAIGLLFPPVRGSVTPWIRTCGLHLIAMATPLPVPTCLRRVPSDLLPSLCHIPAP